MFRGAYKTSESALLTFTTFMIEIDDDIERTEAMLEKKNWKIIYLLKSILKAQMSQPRCIVFCAQCNTVRKSMEKPDRINRSSLLFPPTEMSSRKPGNIPYRTRLRRRIHNSCDSTWHKSSSSGLC